MRLGISITAALLATSLLSGCNTTTESDFKLGRTAVAESPSLRRYVMKQCISDSRRESLAVKKEGAAYMKVPVSKYEITVCRRVVNAMVSGRITYADLNSLQKEKTKLKVLGLLKG